MTVGTVIEDTVSVETTEALVEIGIEEMITTGKLKNSNSLQPYIEHWVYCYLRIHYFYNYDSNHLYGTSIVFFF